MARKRPSPSKNARPSRARTRKELPTRTPERLTRRLLEELMFGSGSNPDVDTLKLISAARKDDKFTLHLTNPPDSFVKPAVGKAVKKFLDADRAAGRKYKVVTRATTNLSVQIPLGG